MARFECNVISYVLQRTVDITVIIPTVTIPESMAWRNKKPSHAVNEKFPVLYLLHGVGNNHATWCGYSNIELYAEERNLKNLLILILRGCPWAEREHLCTGLEIPGNMRLLEDFLRENGVNVTWEPVSGFAHEWRFWNAQVEAFLDWIPRTDSYTALGHLLMIFSAKWQNFCAGKTPMPMPV